MGLFSSITSGLKNIVTGNIGSILEGGASLLGGAMANSANKSNAQAQMDFQERMSGTSLQRAKADAIAAGFNPAMLYTQGGASTPGGASYTATDALSPAVNSAQAGRRLRSDVKTANINQHLIAEQASTTQKQGGLAATQAAKTAKEMWEVMPSQIKLNEALTTQARSNALQAQTNSALAATQLPKARNKAFHSTTGTGKFLDALDKIMESVSPFASSAKSIQ